MLVDSILASPEEDTADNVIDQAIEILAKQIMEEYEFEESKAMELAEEMVTKAAKELE